MAGRPTSLANPVCGPTFAWARVKAGMASCHLDVKIMKRSATAAVAYRHAKLIECYPEGRMHDYAPRQASRRAGRR